MWIGRLNQRISRHQGPSTFPRLQLGMYRGHRCWKKINSLVDRVDKLQSQWDEVGTRFKRPATPVSPGTLSGFSQLQQHQPVKAVINTSRRPLKEVIVTHLLARLTNHLILLPLLPRHSRFDHNRERAVSIFGDVLLLPEIR